MSKVKAGEEIKFEPIGDMVCVKKTIPDEYEFVLDEQGKPTGDVRIKHSGVIEPAEAFANRPEAEVIAVGPQVKQCKEGDLVLIGPNAGLPYSNVLFIPEEGGIITKVFPQK